MLIDGTDFHQSFVICLALLYSGSSSALKQVWLVGGRLVAVRAVTQITRTVVELITSVVSSRLYDDNRVAGSHI